MQRSAIHPPRVQQLPIPPSSSSTIGTVEQPQLGPIIDLGRNGQCSPNPNLDSDTLRTPTYSRDGILDRRTSLSQTSLDAEMSNAAHPPAARTPLASKAKLSFVLKLFQVVDDPSNSDIVTWCEDGAGFRILDYARFVDETLKSICNGEFSSFKRQLSTYGFSKDGRDPRTEKGSERIMLSSKIYHVNGLFRKGRVDLASQIKAGQVKAGSGTTGQSLLLQQLQVEFQAMQQSQTNLSQQLQDVQGQFLSLQSDHQTLQHDHAVVQRDLVNLQQDNEVLRHELQRVTEDYEVLRSAYETRIESFQPALLSPWQGGLGQASIDQRHSDALLEEYTHLRSPSPSQKEPNDPYYTSPEPTASNQQYNPHPLPVVSTVIAQPTYSGQAGTYPHPSPALYDQAFSPQGHALQNPAPAVHVPPNHGTVDPSQINNPPTPDPYLTRQENEAYQPTTNANTTNYQYDGPPDQASRSYGAVAVPPSAHGGRPRQGTIFDMLPSPSGGYLAYFRS